MKKLTQKLLQLIVPVEITEGFELEDIIETDKYIELILKEKSHCQRSVDNKPIEIFRYDTIQLLTFPVKGKQCRLTLRRKRWVFKGSYKTITNSIPGKMYGLKIPEEFGVYLRAIIEQQVTDIPRIARIMRICPKTLQKWYQKNLTDMEMVASENMVVTGNIGKRLKIDEVCLHRGDFWTILSNADNKKACAIIKGTKSSDIGKYIGKFTVQQRFAVEEITLDMSESFDWVARSCFPNAVQVIDRFHVQKHIYDAVQQIRIRERKKILDQEKKNIKDTTIFPNGDTRKQLLARSRGLLFKSCHSWTDSQKERAKILFQEYPEIQKAYLLSQKLKSWYNQKYSRKQAEKRLHQWYEKVEKSEIQPLIDSAHTIKNHEGRILNYFLNRSTNAYAESLNSKIKLFKTLVRGINKPSYFIYRLSTYIT